MTKIYSATFDDVEKNVPVVLINGWILRIDKGEKHFPERFTDLTELVAYPKGSGYWIDFGKGVHRTSPKWISRQLKRIIAIPDVMNTVGESVTQYFGKIADDLLAQLSATSEEPSPAEPRYHSLDPETQEAKPCDFRGFEEDCSEHGEEIKNARYGKPTSPTAKVTVELTERQLDVIGRSLDFAMDGSEISVEEHFLVKDVTHPLTPAPMEEPTEFGAVVEASHQLNPDKRQRWVSSPTYQGDLCWHSEDCAMQPWVHLIAPVRIGGGEK